MRLIPPKNTKSDHLYSKKEFQQYLFNHKVVGNGESITFLDFLNKCLKRHKTDDDAVNAIISMLPLDYQYFASDVLYEYLDEQRNKFKETHEKDIETRMRQR